MFSSFLGTFTILSLSSAACCLLIAVMHGRKLRNGYDPTGIAMHKGWVDAFMWTLVTSLVFLLLFIHTREGFGSTSWLAWVHRALTLVATVLFVLTRFRFTGLSAPRRHPRLAYAFLTFFFATFITGSILLSRI